MIYWYPVQNYKHQRIHPSFTQKLSTSSLARRWSTDTPVQNYKHQRIHPSFTQKLSTSNLATRWSTGTQSRTTNTSKYILHSHRNYRPRAWLEDTGTTVQNYRHQRIHPSFTQKLSTSSLARRRSNGHFIWRKRIVELLGTVAASFLHVR